MPQPSGQKILITGLNGVIGWHVYRASHRRWTSYGTYRKNHPALDHPGLFRIDLDHAPAVRDFITSLKPDFIVHSRGICDLDVCEEHPDMAREINVRGTEILLEAANAHPDLKKFIYVSTDHVFSGSRGGYTEADLPDPKHVYGHTKMLAEEKVRASGLPWLIVRPGLVIGESFQGNKGPRDFLFSRIRAAKPTHLFTDEWRTPIAAEVLAEKILNLIDVGACGIYHLAGGRTCNRYELGIEIARDQGLPLDQIFPRLRREDRWAHIRPEDLSLKSVKQV